MEVYALGRSADKVWDREFGVLGVYGHGASVDFWETCAVDDFRLLYRLHSLMTIPAAALHCSEAGNGRDPEVKTNTDRAPDQGIHNGWANRGTSDRNVDPTHERDAGKTGTRLGRPRF